MAHQIVILKKKKRRPDGYITRNYIKNLVIYLVILKTAYDLTNHIRQMILILILMV